MNAKLLLLLAVALAVAGPAAASDYEYMLSAGELRGMIEQGNRNMAIGYISGVLDAQMRAREFCVPEGGTLTDIGVRAFKLISQQPRESKAPAADVIAVFLHGDYPCRK